MVEKERHYDKHGNPSGWSEKEGDKTTHYGRDANFAGWSEDKGSYTQHYDRQGSSDGFSRKESGLLGGEWTQHYDREGRKGGFDTKESSWIGKEYTQHHDKDGRKTGWSESESSGGGSDSSSGGSGGSSGCFITTACVRVNGLPDDCIELQTARDFRDNYVRNLPSGEEIIREYYNIAPSIITEIDKRENSEEIYQNIKREIDEALTLINLGKKEQAFTIYYNVVKRLKQEYL